MADLQRRPPRRPTRRQREETAYRLVVATGVFTAAGVVGLVLAVVGVIGFGLPIVLLVLAAVTGFVLKRQLGA
jgi:UPF0716 family protein affecting phage T7 exclusion